VAALVPELHRKADELVSLLLQKRGRRRTIDASAHCHCDLHNQFAILTGESD
jgi:hypothetical protein